MKEIVAKLYKVSFYDLNSIQFSPNSRELKDRQRESMIINPPELNLNYNNKQRIITNRNTECKDNENSFDFSKVRVFI